MFTSLCTFKRFEIETVNCILVTLNNWEDLFILLDIQLWVNGKVLFLRNGFLNLGDWLFGGLVSGPGEQRDMVGAVY